MPLRPTGFRGPGHDFPGGGGAGIEHATGIGPFNAQLRRRFSRDGVASPALVRDPPHNARSAQATIDPRAFRQGYAGAGDTYLADARAMGAIEDELANGVAPFEQVIEALDAQNLPPQLKQVPFHVFITAAANPVLLIPYNPKRRGVIVSNYRIVAGVVGVNGVCFSFGQPIQTATGELAGIPLSPCFEETNGTVSVDAIYVFCNDATQFPAQIPVLGYEANIALGRSN